jgi:energy-coupling factor transporter ATP-binding protein EcfA2
MAGTLIAQNLHKAHGAAAILAGVSITVAPGDVLGVVGPNGAGKSTLLRLLAGLDRPDQGDVRLTAGGEPAGLPRPPHGRRGGRRARPGRHGRPRDGRARCRRPLRRGVRGVAQPRRRRPRAARRDRPARPRARPVVAGPGGRGALRRPGRAGVAGRDPALALRRPAAGRADQRPRLRRPGAVGALPTTAPSSSAR